MGYLIALAVITVSSLVAILVILMQKPKENGLSGAITGITNSYIAKHKGITKESKLVRITAVCVAVILIVAILLNFGFMQG